MATRWKLHRFEPRMVLEGGSIDTNGAGKVLTTRSVLLNPNRNSDMDKDVIDQRLRDYLGHEEIIWLNKGLEGDDTDGHIDDITRFVSEDTVMTMVCDDKDDVNHDALAENFEILRSSTDLKIHTIPLPHTKIEGTTVDGSEYVPASYANFYIANGCVLVPIYDPRYDEQALSFFRGAFPDRKVYGIPCADLVWGQGSIHCVTQQLYGMD
jgi:agmatine deiminase